MIKNLTEVERRFAQKKDVAPRNLRHFDQLDSSLTKILKEGEYATANDESNNEYLVWVREGRLWRTLGVEVI